MARRYVFADECGNFDFSTKRETDHKKKRLTSQVRQSPGALIVSRKRTANQIDCIQMYGYRARYGSTDLSARSADLR
jgi:hypothetical protein